MLRGKHQIWVALLAAIAFGITSPVGADEAPTTIEIGSLVLEDGRISVAGVASYGAEALSPATISADPAEGSPGQPGLDIGDLTFTPDPVAGKLIVDLEILDGDPEGGLPPFSGYAVPLMTDGNWEEFRWLFAGTTGTSYELGTPSSAPWGGFCKRVQHEYRPALGLRPTGKWLCGSELVKADADGIRWALNVAPGAIVEGAVSPAQTLGVPPCDGQACSLRIVAPVMGGWPTTQPPWWGHGGLGVDFGPLMEAYQLPGEVKLGISPPGAEPSQVSFATQATLLSDGASFEGSIVAPSSPGSYTVWARTCYGLNPFGASKTCVYGQVNIDVA